MPYWRRLSEGIESDGWAAREATSWALCHNYLLIEEFLCRCRLAREFVQVTDQDNHTVETLRIAFERLSVSTNLQYPWTVDRPFDGICDDPVCLFPGHPGRELKVGEITCHAEMALKIQAGIICDKSGF